MHGRGDKYSLFIIFVRKLKGKHVFEKEWNWEDNIKIDRKKTKCGDMEYNHLCSCERGHEDKGRKIFIIWENVSFSRNCSMWVPDLWYKTQPHWKVSLKIGIRWKFTFSASTNTPLKVILITKLLETPDALKPCKIIHREFGVERLLLVTAVSRGGMLPRKSSIIAGCRAEIWNRIRELS